MQSALWLRATLAALAVTAGGAAACGGDPASGSGDAVGEGGAAARAASDCASCHMSDYRGAPRHVGERPTACAVCHARDAWHPTGLHHDFWPLTGKHETTRCFDCHAGDPPTFHGTDRACVACHRREYDEAPDHAGRFPTTCEECHSTSAWKPQLPGHHEPPRAGPGTPATPSAAPTPTPGPARTTTPTAAPRPTRAPKPSPTPTAQPSPTVEPTTGASKRR